MRILALLLLAVLIGAQSSMAQLDDAKWIGTSTPVLYSDYLPIYRLHCTLQLDKKSLSTNASVLLGGNDPRLMNRNLNMQGVEAQRDSTYIRVEFDANGKGGATPTRLNVFRAGYAKDDNASKPIAVAREYMKRRLIKNKNYRKLNQNHPKLFNEILSNFL